MSPPLRQKKDRETLWAGLNQGLVNLVSTDHCTFFMEQKRMGENDFSKIPNGAPSIEHRLELLYSEGVRKDRISLNKFVEVTSTNAAKIYGMFPKKGTIAAGSDADIVIFDPNESHTISVETHHHNCEFIDRQKEYGHKEGYTLKAYAKIRKQLIFKISDDKLNSEEVNLLTRLTRGLIEEDIKKCVLNYINSKTFPLEREKRFPSNTCDPFTGNWAERLMHPYELLEFFTQNGFNGQVIAGVYENRNNLTTKKFIPKINMNIAPIYNPISKLVNRFINLFSKKGLYLAPYYILYAFK